MTKLDPTGSALVYSTYLGGSGGDEGSGIAIDSAGNAYGTGHTSSPDFPTTAGAFQTSFGGGFEDAFVVKIGSSPAEQLTDVGTLIQGFGLPHGMANSLLAKVGAAQASLAVGDTTGACDALQALINEAQAQSGQHLTAAQATAIIVAAQAIRTALGCP